MDLNVDTKPKADHTTAARPEVNKEVDHSLKHCDHCLLQQSTLSLVY